MSGCYKTVLDEICVKNSDFKTWFEGERLEFSKRKVVKSHKEMAKEKGERLLNFFLSNGVEYSQGDR
jgi:hypothetical protein